MRGAYTERGSVFVYILAAIFLAGVLVVTLSSGPEKSSVTVELDDMVANIAGEIAAVESAVANCTLLHPSKVDVDEDGADDFTNPNVPFPIYATTGTLHGGDGSADAGKALADILCPGAPGQPGVFAASAGTDLPHLSDTAEWTVTYYNNSDEGAYFRILRAEADPLWLEALSRLDEKYSECKAAPLTTGGCANGCFHYWFSRLSTSAVAVEGGCP